MNFIYIFGAFALVAYGLQVLFGMKQIKHFNQIYLEMRRKGKVAIGRRSGKIKAGTIVMFAIDHKRIIIDARKMQGVTVLAKFRLLPQYIGTDIHYIDSYHPLVRTENKLVQQAMANAREIYLRVELGNYQEELPPSPLTMLGIQFSLWKKQYLSRKRSVE